MLKNKNKYLEITRSLAPDIFPHRTFHTTFIIKKNKIQKIGINCNKTHPKNLKYDYVGREGVDIRGFVGVHSELSAILKYGKDDCSDCIFVNVRIDKNGSVSMAMPCRGCQSLFNQVGFKRVYYTDRNGEFKIWR
jgi:deoxycytidylate deaminase